MLIMSIPDEEIWQFACSRYAINLFARWHQRLWFKNNGVWGHRVSVWR